MQEARLRLADWRHQEAMLYEGAALTAATGSLAAAVAANDTRKMAASGLALVFAYYLLEEAKARKGEAEALLSKLHGGMPVTRKLTIREFLRHPAGKMAVTGAVIAAIRIILRLLGYNW